MCTTFANAGPLPLMFNDALFPAASPIRQNVAAAISFYLLVWMPLFWMFGRDILAIPDKSLISNTTINTNRFMIAINKVLSPPIIGSIIGVIIGCIPILRNACFSGDSSSSFLRPVISAISTLGSAYIPVAVLILAGSLFGSESKSNQIQIIDDDQACLVIDTNDTICTDYARPSKQAMLSIFIARFVLAPIVSFGLLFSFQKSGWLLNCPSSTLSVFTFVLLMEGCMPPTQNSVIMLQLEQEPERAARMAKLLTTLYLLSLFPVTILISICFKTNKTKKESNRETK
jgi:Membrane transport protein